VKPFSIVLSLILGLAALSLVVWVGRFGAKLPIAAKVDAVAEAQKHIPSVDDLPMPESGPFGKAELSELEFNFGVRNVGDEDKHVFTLKNIGDGVLKFKMGKPTCQCTVGEITSQNGEVVTKDGEAVKEGPIAPGESINILVKWVMKTQNDKFRQIVPVFTTDPDQRKIELAIMGAVDQPLHLLPDGFWDFGDMSATEPSQAQGYVSSKVLDSFTITEVPRENSKVKVSWELVDPLQLAKYDAKCGYLIKVEGSPDVPIGKFREAIKLKCQSGDNEMNLEFTVGGRRSGPIEVRGVIGATFNVDTNRLFFGEFPASTGKKAKVNFIVKDLDGELTLNSIEPADARIKLTMPETGKQFGKSKSYQVEVEIPPGPPAKHRNEDAEVLNLKFNHPGAPEFKLAVDYHAN
jgi:Protein of unknown function (DUF1573)